MRSCSERRDAAYTRAMAQRQQRPLFRQSRRPRGPNAMAPRAAWAGLRTAPPVGTSQTIH
eukprot:365803-Chlamydomonas_euryale.AAC.7